MKSWATRPLHCEMEQWIEWFFFKLCVLLFCPANMRTMLFQFWITDCDASAMSKQHWFNVSFLRYHFICMLPKSKGIDCLSFKKALMSFTIWLDSFAEKLILSPLTFNNIEGCQLHPNQASSHSIFVLNENNIHINELHTYNVSLIKNSSLFYLVSHMQMEV